MRSLDFLRLSRASIDDTITQNLNALVKPSEVGFDPRSTSQRTPTSSHDLPFQACQMFKEKVLFPAWQARSMALNYCGFVAMGPDPDDFESELRDADNQRVRERVIDERLDPYSGRFSPRESRSHILAALVLQEREVENIVRSRTWDVVQQRCAAPHEHWDYAFELWKEKLR